MIETSHPADSEFALMNELHKMADAGCAVIQVRTREPIRAVTTLRKHLINSDTPYQEWDVVNGNRTFTKENYADHQIKGDDMDFIQALRRPLENLRDGGSALRANASKVHYYVYVDSHYFVRGNPFAIELIQQYAAMLPSTNVCILFVTNEEPLPDVPMGTVMVTDFNTPTVGELEENLVKLIEASLNNGTDTQESSFPDGSDMTEEDFKQVAQMGLGMTSFEFETYAALALIDAETRREKSVKVEFMLKGIAEGKTAVVRQSEILELSPSAAIEDVGGMERLKDWVSQRKGAFSEEAQEFGVEAPKGIALVGVPGTGKSLVAKAIASVFGIPLVRLDFGRVFSKYVGDSESRVRAALKMVESMSPCVLFVDEIDKGLGGASGGGDSGTSSRVLGSFLTWLQENQKPVFTVVTANRTQGLPPELLRRGRFDGIFSVSMPGAYARREVLGIHLRKRGRSIDDFDPNELAIFDQRSDGYVPAEIEAALKDAITVAYSEPEKELKMSHIIAALEDMVPMSKANAAAIASIVEWANNNATPCEYTDTRPNPKRAKAPAAAPAGRRVVRTHR